MSREAKRVPLNFGWPLNKTWEGYLTPEWLQEEECSVCEGDGLSYRARQLKDLWWGYVEFKPEDNGSTPLGPEHPAVVAFAKKNAVRAPDFYLPRGGLEAEAKRLAGMWDSQWKNHINEEDLAVINAHRDSGVTDPREYVVKSIQDPFFGASMDWFVVVKAKCEKEGIAFKCAWCDGEGSVEKWKGQREVAEAWQPFDPPEGPGWQLWETTSEGSPISPVFESAEELAKWCAVNATVFGSSKATEERWLAIITGEDPGLTEIAPNVFAL